MSEKMARLLPKEVFEGVRLVSKTCFGTAISALTAEDLDVQHIFSSLHLNILVWEYARSRLVIMRHRLTLANIHYFRDSILIDNIGVANVFFSTTLRDRWLDQKESVDWTCVSFDNLLDMYNGLFNDGAILKHMPDDMLSKLDKRLTSLCPTEI